MQRRSSYASLVILLTVGAEPDLEQRWRREVEPIVGLIAVPAGLHHPPAIAEGAFLHAEVMGVLASARRGEAEADANFRANEQKFVRPKLDQGCAADRALLVGMRRHLHPGPI